ncbi:hypothetical protein DPMN_017685 [Dreissena polymorpha]|uniref:Uncharacterized protein n=1 Tax=Dreissena polymorpha TaxID=45954 RepID=A0A9D4S8E9_DREPO|nr:hypothetical protein DPMN_017685 [Dreissena polymorpha]
MLSMVIVHAVHGQCPCCPQTLSMLSMDNVHPADGQWPWTVSMPSMNIIHGWHGQCPCCQEQMCGCHDSLKKCCLLILPALDPVLGILKELSVTFL